MPRKIVAAGGASDFASDELPAVGVFRQPVGSSAVRGTFLTATGDYRFLAGEVRGDRLSLSCFDGAHAFLFDARVEADGTLRGDFRSGNWWHETWTARRDPDAAVPDAFTQTRWNERVSLADLAFPDTDGRLQSLADPALAGEGYVLVAFGSWCPNCHDEAPYLVELHRRYAARGLSIVGLAFELTGDFEADARQVEVFRERYGIEYPLLVAGTANKADATEALGALDFLRSYPTTVFLESDGGVRAIHSGYAGPATGDAHAALRAEFEGHVEALLAHRPAGDDARWSYLTSRPWWTDASFAGTSVVFRERADGARVAHVTVHGSGRPILSEQDFPVTLLGDAVWFDGGAWKLDRRAGVLVDPLRFGARLRPRETPVPYLAERGRDTEAALVAALADPDPFVRREAVVGLTKAREPRGHAHEELLPLLDDPDLEVRVAAAWAAGRLHVDAAREALSTFLEHPNARLRRESARAVARMATAAPSMLLLLRPLEDDPDPLTRALVREALGSD